MTYRTQEKLGTAIYLVTICIVLSNLFFNRGEHENRILEVASFVSLLVSAVYGIYLNGLKKKLTKKI